MIEAPKSPKRPNPATRAARSAPAALLLALGLAALPLLGSGCATARTAILLPFEVADRSLDLAGKSLGLAAQGVELAARGGRLAYEQINARMDTAEAGARVVGEAVRAARDAEGSNAGSR
jgi:hypothetical protein